MKATKKSLITEFINTQTEIDKIKAFAAYQLTDLPKINEYYFFSIWISIKGRTPKKTKIEHNHEDYLNIVRKMRKEQEALMKIVHTNKMSALLTDDISEKKLLLLEADKVMDAVQKKNIEIRNYMEANS
jgi:hypothetical protein